jgi:hypothetical protein
MLTNLFPSEELSQTEIDLIAEIFAKPEVKKYLRILARNDSMELLALNNITFDDEKLAKTHAMLHGKLQVLSTLSSLEKSK